MSHRRYTKQVLITSISSLLLCCLTFLGTTYAWFTDSVTSGVNTIQAGSLQVDLVNENNESIVGKQAVFHMTDGSTDSDHGTRHDVCVRSDVCSQSRKFGTDVSD